MLLVNDKKMKIAYDHQIFLQEVGGISRYFKNLVGAIDCLGYCESHILAQLHKCSYFDGMENGLYLPSLFGDYGARILKARKVNLLIKKINEQFTLRSLKKQDFDVIHVTDNSTGYLEGYNNRAPVVLTIHDLIPERYPGLFPDIKKRLRERLEAIKIADSLICISEATRSDLSDFYDISNKKIYMIHHGSPDYMSPRKENGVPYSTEKKYILFVGDRKNPYKNFWPMIDAIDGFMKSEAEFNLFCIGSKFTNEEQIKISKYSWCKRVKALRVTDGELYSVYERAYCLLMPSIYEGFGFPLLEAMKASCPIICSNTSCIPEIAGEAAHYFDPLTFSGIDNLIRACRNENGNGMLVEQQKKRLSQFSWGDTANKTIEVYAGCCDN